MDRAYERLELRLPKDLKTLLECAVGLEGGSLNAFVASAVHRAATDTLERHQRTVVSARDWKTIMDALEETDYQPTPDNVADLALYRRFQETGRLPE